MSRRTRVVTALGIGHEFDDDGRVWIDQPRPKGAYLLEEIEAQGLQGVRVWLEERLESVERIDDGTGVKSGRVVALAGEAIPWEVALEHGLVGPVRVSMADMAETRGAGRG